VGIKLEFEPIIQLDDQIVIKSSMEDSSITNTVVNNGTTAYQIGTRNVSTTLTLRDGETQVLAGLIRTDEQNTTNQLPGLSQIPGFGVLFQNPSNANNKKEILLSITPHVVRNIHRPTDDLLSINAGPDAQSQPQGALGNNNAPMQPPRPVTPPAPIQNRPLTPVPNSPTTPTAPSMLTPLVPFGQPSQTATPAMAPGAMATPTPTPAVATPALAPAPSAPPGLPVFDMPPGVGMKN
jgi:general secretion pathway protein D